ncbi:MAG: hypothetical protein M3322_07300, partial [Actinomycetota bacterium]|nr:hypothetical protein [Actinomycetota bacterium]
MHGRNREFAALLAELGYRGIALGGDRPIEDASPSAHVVAAPEGHPLVLDFTSGNERELETPVRAPDQRLS